MRVMNAVNFLGTAQCLIQLSIGLLQQTFNITPCFHRSTLRQLARNITCQPTQNRVQFLLAPPSPVHLSCSGILALLKKESFGHPDITLPQQYCRLTSRFDKNTRHLEIEPRINGKRNRLRLHGCVNISLIEVFMTQKFQLSGNINGLLE